MARETSKPHWLELYGTKNHNWQYRRTDDDVPYDVFHRRLGIVESMFDSDGFYWEGRADIHPNMQVELKTSLSPDQLRQRIILAWTLIRHSHVLLSCCSMFSKDLSGSANADWWINKHFVYKRPKTIEAALRESSKQVVFLEDYYRDVDPVVFQHHLMNTARAFDSEQSLCKVFVLPPKANEHGNSNLRFMLVWGHEITDGLTIYLILNHFIEILNQDQKQIEDQLQKVLTRDGNSILSRLPPTQESLYPPRAQTKARERWHWAITRVLKYVRTPLPAAFQNPLAREKPLSQAKAYPPTYSEVLNYSRTTVLNTTPLTADMSKLATHNLARMCKQAGISVGSGTFTLVAIIMMHFEELRNPDIPLNERLPFVGGFPVNPRPFLSAEATGGEGSCMLAFSDGVVLPFLPGELDFHKRFRVLGRLAHRQLRQYQKRRRTAEEVMMGSNSPAELIPSLYLYTLDRMETRFAEVDPARRVGYDIYGAYQPARPPTMGTCGISSVGDTSSFIRVGKYDVNETGQKDLVVDLRTLGSSVRPRDKEFLVGAAGNKDHLGFLVSVDMNQMDPEKMQQWKVMIEGILDKEMFPDIKRNAPSPNAMSRESRL